MRSFFVYHNLVTVVPDDTHHTENSILFLAEYCLIFKEKNGFLPFSNAEIKGAIEFHRVSDNRFVAHPDGYDESVENPWSHDNHTGVVVLSKLCGFDYHKRFGWDYLMYRTQPWNLAFYFYMMFSDSIFRYLIYPFVYMMIALKGIESMKTHDTSGKILTYVHTTMLNMNRYKKIALKMSEKYDQPDWKTIFAVYFKETDHPINKLFDK